MPPLARSRYSNCVGLRDPNGNLFLSDRTPYRFKDLPDNQFHTVVLGDTLWSLAEQYFPNIPDSADLYWVIADFQPDPIFDPTLALDTGRTMVIPAERVVFEEILNPANA